MLKDVDILYLTLLKKALTRTLSPHSYEMIPRNTKTPLRNIRSLVYEQLNKILSAWNLALVQTNRPSGETMIGFDRLNNLQDCVTDIIKNNILGDFVEAGVWRGGACIFMKALLNVYKDDQRIIWLADSFQGLPKPNPEKYPDDANDTLWSHSLDVSLEEVKSNFAKYDLFDENRLRFLVGFFSETMPIAPIEKISLLRLDGDMYESTIEVLDNLIIKFQQADILLLTIMVVFQPANLQQMILEVKIRLLNL